MSTLPPKKNLNEIPDNAEALREQIAVRRKMRSEMVGWLYARILDDEIEKLRDRLLLLNS
jgi:hypothetical protein